MIKNLNQMSAFLATILLKKIKKIIFKHYYFRKYKTHFLPAQHQTSSMDQVIPCNICGQHLSRSQGSSQI